MHFLLSRYQSASRSLLGDAALLGSDRAASLQVRSKWQDFQAGGWKPDGMARPTNFDMDLAEREKLDKAEKILKFGVNAAVEDVL